VRQRDRADVVLHERNEGLNEGNRVGQCGFFLGIFAAFCSYQNLRHFRGGMALFSLLPHGQTGGL